MQLRHLAGRTYAIESKFASLGVYLLDEGCCLLIDSGQSAAHAREVLRIFREQGWVVYAIFNTHGHADHCGGNRFLQESSGCRIYATAIEAAFIENPLLLPYTVYSAYPPKLLMGKFFMPEASRVTHRVEAGSIFIQGTRFEAIALAGHSLGQLGLITPDGVFFTGDSLVTPQILQAFPCVFLADVDQQLSTLEKLASGGYASLYLSHGGRAEKADDIIKVNHEVLMNNLKMVESIIQVPRSLEGVVSEFATRQSFEMNRNYYFRLSNTISAMLAYLVNQGQAAIIMQGNVPQYCLRNKATTGRNKT